MMWWNNSWGSGWGWPVILVLGVAMVVCMAMMARMMMRHGGSGLMPPMSNRDNRDENTPERILARRLASGEIDVQEFEGLRDALQRASTATADPTEPSAGERHPPAA